MNKNHTKEFELINKVDDMLLEFADEQELMTRSDFQGRAGAVAREIIKLIRENENTKNERTNLQRSSRKVSGTGRNTK